MSGNVMRSVVCATLCSCAGHIQARGADVSVVKTGAERIPISISGLSVSGAGSKIFVQVLQEDLRRSGWFRVVTGLGGTIAVHGSCRDSGNSLSATCRLVNIGMGRTYFNKSYRGSANEARSLAHVFADDIVGAVKGVQGIASTRIAFVGVRGGKKDIYLCDADGHGLVQMTRDGIPCLTPSWGHDAGTLIYTSFLGGYPDLYEIDLQTHKRQRISSYPGINSGADVSPDGRSIALVLSKDGNPDLYVLRRRSGRLTRLTRTRHAAEASPSWSPDGRQIVYVSGSTGAPHLYVVGSSGGERKRIAFRGTENVSPDWGTDGRIVYSSRRNRKYEICVFDPRTGKDVQVTSGGADHESPTWAPDARHIVCSRTVGYHSEVYILDTLGGAPVRLISLDGEWHSPAWSPR